MTAFAQLRPPADEPGPPDEWCRWYRALGMPAFLRGEFVELRTDDHIAVLVMPSLVAQTVAEHVECGPVLSSTARTSAGRYWKFLVKPDNPLDQPLNTLDGAEVRVLALGARVLLPTGPDRHDREGCEWVQPPDSEHELPALSMVAATAVREWEQLREMDDRAPRYPDTLFFRGGVR